MKLAYRRITGIAIVLFISLVCTSPGPQAGSMATSPNEPGSVFWDDTATKKGVQADDQQPTTRDFICGSESKTCAPVSEERLASLNSTIPGLVDAQMDGKDMVSMLSKDYSASEIAVGMMKAGYNKDYISSSLQQNGLSEAQALSTVPGAKAATRDLVTTGAEGNVTGAYNYTSSGEISGTTAVGEGGTIIGWTTYDAYGRADKSYNGQGSLTSVYVYNSHGFLDKSLSIGANGVTTGWTTYDAYGRAAASYNDRGAQVQRFEYNANGFLSRSVSIGEGGVETGYTTYNALGRQDASYNEAGALVAKYHYSSAGFLSSATNYGQGGTVVGKTTYDVYGRPADSFNAQGSKVQTYNYGSDGFLKSSTSFGNNGVTTGQTFFDDYGRSTHSTNAEGATVQKFEYSDSGFLAKSINIASNGDTNGYTTFDAYGHMGESYNKEGSKVASYDYENGFIVRSNEFGDDGTPNGYTTYDNQGRQFERYNQEGVRLSINDYNPQGFITQTRSFNDGTPSGHTEYNDLGRATKSFNAEGTCTSENFYDTNGFLAYTTNYGSGTGEPGTNPGGGTNTGGTIDAKTMYKAEWDAKYADLFGDLTPETLTNAAWAKLDAKDYEAAMACALKCIVMYEQKAKDEKSEGLINQVGTAYFILGQAAEQQGDKQTATRAYQTQLINFPNATCFDPETNSSWNVSDASRARLAALSNESSNSTERETGGVDPAEQNETPATGGIDPPEQTDNPATGGIDPPDQQYSFDNGSVVGHTQLTWNTEWETRFASQFGDFDPETLTTAAWNNLSANNVEATVASALKCIGLYEQQALTTGDQGLINHVGTAYFILGQAMELDGNNESAAVAYQAQIVNFASAEAYDPTGGFWWSVTEGSRNQLQAMGF